MMIQFTTRAGSSLSAFDERHSTKTRPVTARVRMARSVIAIVAALALAVCIGLAVHVALPHGLATPTSAAQPTAKQAAPTLGIFDVHPLVAGLPGAGAARPTLPG